MNQIQKPFTENAAFQSQTVARSFISNVFSWMFLALAITAGLAYFTSENETMLRMMVNFETGSVTAFGWIVTFAPFALVLFMSFGFNSMRQTTMIALFLVYSALMGMSLSFILLVYTAASVFKTFIITAGMFGVMALVGYTTKTDLTRFGSILLMGLIGIIIAMLVNFFMQSERLDYIISFIGVLIFTGLTAYDVQKLKNMGALGLNDGETMGKMTIFGALTLYLDFINLFLFLLRFFGRSRD